MWASLLAGIGDLLAPARCIVCLAEGSWWCAACAGRVILPSLVCLQCKKVSQHGFVCPSCRHTTALTGTVNLGSYHTPYLARGIHWLKFKGVRPVANPLGTLLAERLATIAPVMVLRQFAVLIPIPLHRQRVAQRGFNQSEDIAHVIAAATGIPMHPMLSRPRATWTQSQLPAELRHANLHGAFTLIAPLPPRIRFVFIVDDVMTTGATLSAAAETIVAAAGERRNPLYIWGCTVAWA